ncbi:hypothetical protein TSUD_158850 [Trifolium subterraneum]|uniref:Wall-associated receptor kinase galacturonan-binding domain-containing protein n=1 Tax=Trifolium subterraneum TaxID=3900 RepID=A0A2Z6N9I2_TRISU|nr:hypothetical protein TSUD_158850 [Trifolium subterraneum]
MLSLSLSSPTIIIFSIFIFSLHHTTSLPSQVSLSICNNTTFNCGTITNLSYPFTGGDRPSFCGPPQFHLNCQNGVPELNISSVSYRVLQINSATHSLTLARLDLWNETCTHQYINSSFDGTIFSYGLGNRNLTLFYGCKPTSVFTEKPDNLFYCDSNGYKNNSYSLIGPFPLDPILSVVKCDEGVGVPILEEQANSNPLDDDCIECIRSGGQQCGFDYDDNEPICICGNELCPSSGKSSNTGIIIGVVAGVAVLVCILGACFVVRRRKKRAEKSRSIDVFMPPPSSGTGTGTLTSTTNSSQTNMAVNKIQGQELHELVDPELGYEKDNSVRRMTTAVAELAFRCLQQQKDLRPSMDEVLEILKAIKSDELETHESKLLDVVVRTDELVLLKKGPYPTSPDSVADKWVSGSSTSTTTTSYS